MFPGIYIGDFLLPSYGMCGLIAVFAAFPFAVKRYYKITRDAFSMIFVILWAAIGAFFGMHLLFGLTNVSYWHEMFEAKSFNEFLGAFGSIFGGAVYYGGLLCGIAAGALSVKFQGLRLDIVSDCAAPAIPLFHGIARIGCFLAGCCYGVEWEHGITFTNSLIDSANGVPRVPVQLIESGFNLITAGVLMYIFYGTAKLRGLLLPLYLTIYSAGRFGLEFLRGDDYRGHIFGLSTSQFISIPIFIICISIILVHARPGRRKTRKVTRNFRKL